MTDAEFLAIASQNPINAELLRRLPALGLNQCYLTAGCLFQPIWNRHAGLPVDWGINDYDVFYFDDSDLSEEAEDRVIRLVKGATHDLNANVEVKNQARVHLWYPKRFHATYPQLRNTRDGIDRYLVACTRIGVNVATGELYAPDGLADLTAGVLRLNPLYPDAKQFAAKASSYQERWSWLRIE